MLINDAIWPIGIGMAGTGGVLVALVQGVINRRKLGADAAHVLTDAAANLMREAHEDNRALREDNRALREDNRALSDQVADLRRQVEDLKAQLTQVHRDVTATRTAVERREQERDGGAYG